jgi:aspartokinase/homoserine dehydrogenase 1
VFNSLGDASISVRAIAQGASERNISVVVDGKAGAKALRAVHAAFYLSPNTLSIGLIGPGIVGRALLAQIGTQIERLRGLNLDLRVRGIAGSKRMLLEETAVDMNRWAERMAEAGEPLDLEKFTNHLQADYIPHTVIVDCTASADVGKNYAAWLGRGIHVVTPNKKANSGTLPYYREMRDAGRASGSHYLYEATVGAGLPIIQTLRDLRQTGDEITRIEGIFSGTLAYLFNVFDGRESFSSIVRTAKAKGYTEPDPRDDLSGMDVARKLIILAREMGLTLEMTDVRVEGLVPKEIEDCSVEEFMARLPEFDAGMAAMLSDARSKHEVLRYVGRIDADGTATVGLIRLDAKHAFANIALTDNVVRFATRRYCDNPLIVQGPGAGPEVTAGGVFSDLLRLSAYLGAHL